MFMMPIIQISLTSQSLNKITKWGSQCHSKFAQNAHKQRMNSNHDNPEYINKIMIEYLPEYKHSIKCQPLLLELNNILKINVVMWSINCFIMRGEISNVCHWVSQQNQKQWAISIDYNPQPHEVNWWISLLFLELSTPTGRATRPRHSVISKQPRQPSIPCSCEEKQFSLHHLLWKMRDKDQILHYNLQYNVKASTLPSPCIWK